jgi:DNA polymerase I
MNGKKKMSNYDNALIYGKSTKEGIVSVEADGSNLIIFKEVEGNVVTEVIPNKYWLITNKRASSKQVELDGNQYFKYLATFDDNDEQRKVRMLLRQKKFDFYDIWNPKESSLLYHGMTYYKGLKPKDISILSFDIEADSLVETDRSEVYIITNTFRRHGKITRKAFFLENYKNQAEMLIDWCRWVREMDPSIVCGHNIYGYDFRYLQHVANLSGVSLHLGRAKKEILFNEYTSKKRKDGSQDLEYTECFIYGREIVDTMFLALTYDVGRNFESYGLKPIVKHLGMEKDGRVFVDASKMRIYYNNRHKDPDTWNLVKKYAEEDSDDALKLFDHMAPSYFYFTQSVSKSFQQMINSATGSQINNIMVRAYFQDGHSIAKTTAAEHFEGAISFGIPGVYKNCFKQDVASLYPSIMRQFQVYDKYKDPKKYFLEIVEHFTLERLKNKKIAKETGDQYYKDLQESQKIAINSAYGFMGAQGLNYNSPYNAALVTRKGREILAKAVEFATGNKVDYWKSLAGEEKDAEA